MNEFLTARALDISRKHGLAAIDEISALIVEAGGEELEGRVREIFTEITQRQIFEGLIEIMGILEHDARAKGKL